ncbi:uncharacterized protein LOC9654211 [Selaginella moellendorffii]|uniref:uncharacterized protein LOC9654211 n=1 Tax=Selaginella moellendorffii TaxID=88036 RepID=UPI000D1CB099|nr:uncharacterized protein LOC9654211 [Selaginella moellendorffii]|eukprot:XP_024524502.1 uncharacterized protein LOC9654211 [Selaginella moellendorffii]
MFQFGGGAQAAPVAAAETPSLLSDWKAYAMGGGGSAAATVSHDQEAGAFRSAFNTVTTRVTNLPGNVQTAATGGLPSRNQLLYFSIMLGAGCFFIFISLVMFLPLIVLMPAKFASCFSLGSCLVIGSFFALKGPRAQLAHMMSKEVPIVGLIYLETN